MSGEMLTATLLSIIGFLLALLIGAFGYGFNRLLNLEVKVAEGEPPPWFEHWTSSMEKRMERIEGKVDQIRNGQH